MLPRFRDRLFFALVSLGLGAGAMGQMSIEPPPPPQAAAPADQTPTAPAPASVPPATAPRASTLPSAASVLQGIMQDKPAENSISPGRDPVSRMAKPAVEGVAPNQPPAPLLREGDTIYSRTGRLTRDEKTGMMLFVFDSDGKKMADPPVGVIPCRYLGAVGRQIGSWDDRGKIPDFRGNYGISGEELYLSKVHSGGERFESRHWSGRGMRCGMRRIPPSGVIFPHGC